jgi:hypothetical protein
MIPQTDFIDEIEVEKVRSWLQGQDKDVQMAVVFEVARLRIMDVADPLFSLRYIHSESTRNAILSSLHSPGISAALMMFEIEPDRFVRAVELEVRKFGTTRPDDFWRKCGVGRPPKKCEVAI